MGSRLAVTLLLGVILSLFVAEKSDAENESFEADFEKAEQTFSATGGAEYNDRLYRYFRASAETSEVMDVCLKSDIPKELVRGFIRFHKKGGYTVQLRPMSLMAACVVGAFSGRDPPEPPQRPYVSLFAVKIGN